MVIPLPGIDWVVRYTELKTSEFILQYLNEYYKLFALIAYVDGLQQCTVISCHVLRKIIKTPNNVNAKNAKCKIYNIQKMLSV